VVPEIERMRQQHTQQERPLSPSDAAPPAN